MRPIPVTIPRPMTWLLDNWSECGFQCQPKIVWNQEYFRIYVDRNGESIHSSLAGAKRKFRNQYVKVRNPHLRWSVV